MLREYLLRKLQFFNSNIVLHACSGVIIRVWELVEVGKRQEATTKMIANSISVRRKICDFSTQETKDVFRNYWAQYSNNPLLARDNIVTSICPQVAAQSTWHSI